MYDGKFQSNDKNLKIVMSVQNSKEKLKLIVEVSTIKNEKI